MKRIYYGGYCSIEKPEFINSKYPKDFGNGFYCTDFLEQAQRWSIRYKTPVISVYEYVEDSTLSCLYFDQMTEDWLDFIVHCRLGKLHHYDIIAGAMANDQIWNYVADYIDGILTREQFWVLSKFKHPTHQIAFCTEIAFSSLHFVESVKVEK